MANFNTPHCLFNEFVPTLFLLFCISIFPLFCFQTDEPYYTIQFQHGQQRCFSICTYTQQCRTILIEEYSNSNFVCQFYDKTAELLDIVNNPSTTVVSSILYSIVQRYRSCLEWYSLAGARQDAKYIVVNEKGQLIELECKLEFESCLDVYNLGFRANGVYKVNENDQIIEKQ